MFCPNCGKNNVPGAAFCDNCGTPLQAQQPQQPYAQQPYTQQPYAQQPYEQQPYAPQDVQPKKPVNKKLIGIICAVVAAIAVVVILLVVLLGGSSYESVAVDFVEAVVDGDIDEVEKCLHPDMADYIMPEFEDMADEIKRADMDVSVSVAGSKEMSSRKADDLKETMEDYFDIDADDIGEIYNVDLDLEMEYDGDTNEGTLTVVVAEIDGDWYVISIDDDF